MSFQVEEDGIVHQAFGVIADDIHKKKQKHIVFTAYACDDVARGRQAPTRFVSSGRVVTCLLCIIDTRHR